MRRLPLAILLAVVPKAQGGPPIDSGQFLRRYCIACHQGKSAIGGIKITDFLDSSSFSTRAAKWNSIVTRIRNGEMPPKGSPAPRLDDREAFIDIAQRNLKAAACAAGIVPGAYPTRRLNRSEYSATIRDLLNIHLDVGADLPSDGAGGEGFDNAAETLFLSPIHAEKYLAAAKLAIATAMGDDRTRARLLSATPTAGKTPDSAATEILESFLPRAFRRRVTKDEIRPYLDLFHLAIRQGRKFENAMSYSLTAVLVSGDFLFRSEPANPSAEQRLVDDYSMASRLSYFLWGSMPDGLLFDLAEQRKLQDPEILQWQIQRMLRSPKTHDFVKRFVEQWLNTRELGRSVKPDLGLFPEYGDEELRSDIRYQPVVFFQELLVKDLSLLNLIDSRFTFVTRKLQKHYGFTDKLARPDTAGMPQRFELPEGSDRGGLLGMAAILAVSSHPHRTSPVLRGKWLLESVLGTPPPPPPPDVPELMQEPGKAAVTLRELLTEHRANPVCASCHDRIDPLGFALENYDVLGRWRTTDAGKPIDAAGELLDGTKFNGPIELKKALLARRDLFVHHLTTKMLGYALGRGLSMQDTCTVDGIVKQLEKSDYSGQTLIREIVLSVPFRYQASAPRDRLKTKEESSAK